MNKIVSHGLVGLAGGVLGLMYSPGKSNIHDPFDNHIVDRDLAEFVEITSDAAIDNIGEDLAKEIRRFRHGPHDTYSVDIDGRTYALVKIRDEDAKGDVRICALARDNDRYIDILREGRYTFNAEFQVNTLAGGSASDVYGSFGGSIPSKNPYILPGNLSRKVRRELEKMEISSYTGSGLSLGGSGSQAFHNFVDQDGEKFSR